MGKKILLKKSKINYNVKNVITERQAERCRDETDVNTLLHCMNARIHGITFRQI